MDAKSTVRVSKMVMKDHDHMGQIITRLSVSMREYGVSMRRV